MTGLFTSRESTFALDQSVVFVENIHKILIYGYLSHFITGEE